MNDYTTKDYKAKIKDQIEKMEDYHWTAGGRLNGRHTKVKNLRIKKKQNIAIYDVVLIDDTEGHIERHNKNNYILQIGE